MFRRILLLFIAAAAVYLVPWTGYLARTLPDRFDTDQWRLAWVGFDIALLCCFAAAAWLGVRRRRATIPMLAATATLLCCDAWFDVVLDWSGSDRWLSLAMAVFAEVPIALLLMRRSRDLLVGGMPRRSITVADMVMHNDEFVQRLTHTLALLGPTTAATVAEAMGVAEAEVTAKLTELAGAGYVRQSRDGRWQGAHQSLHLPRMDTFTDGERPMVEAFMDARNQRELRLLTWAAGRRAEFGSWGRAERAGTRLTEAELDRFNAEYRDLVTRYCMLHTGPAEGTREVALRLYAFPMPDQPLDQLALG